MVRAIGDKPGSTPSRERVFTPAQATATLPLVRQIAADVALLHLAIEGQRSQIREIDRIPDTIQLADYHDELRDIRSSLELDETRMEKCVAELLSLGIQPHQPIDGGVDFPAILNRRRVQLCWLPGDSQVEYWHDVDEPCSRRQKLDERA